MDFMFAEAQFFDAHLSQWHVSRVVDMPYMFLVSSSIYGNGIDNWDMSHVKAMMAMFHWTVEMDANFSF
jgi:Mycoplasma protein of unknown function, DUF285